MSTNEIPLSLDSPISRPSQIIKWAMPLLRTKRSPWLSYRFLRICCFCMRNFQQPIDFLFKQFFPQRQLCQFDDQKWSVLFLILNIIYLGLRTEQTIFYQNSGFYGYCILYMYIILSIFRANFSALGNIVSGHVKRRKNPSNSIIASSFFKRKAARNRTCEDISNPSLIKNIAEVDLKS